MKGYSLQHFCVSVERIHYTPIDYNEIKQRIKEKSVPYMDYVAKIKNKPIAKVVKLADLKHNSDLSRLELWMKKALTRVENIKRQ